MSAFAGASGKVLDKEIRAKVRVSNAGEVTIMTRGMRGSLDTVFYTVEEAKLLMSAIRSAIANPMHDYEVDWSGRE